MFCIKCGSQVADNAVFCQKCGAPIAVVDSVQQTSTEPVSTASQKPVEPTVPTVSKPAEPIPHSPTQVKAMPNPAQQSSAEQKTPQTPITSTADGSALTKDELSVVTKFSKILRLLLFIGAGLLIIVSAFSEYYDMGLGWVIPNIVASAFMILMAVWSGKSLNNVNYNKLGTTVTIIMAGFILTPLRVIFNIFYFHYYDYISSDYEDLFLPALDVFAIVFSLALLIIAFKLKPFLAPKRRIKVIGITGIMGILILAILLVFTRTKYPDEVLFHGLPVTRFLEMTRDDVIKEFGEPRYSTRGGEYYGYDIEDIRYSNNNGKVVYVRFSSSNCTFNGRVLSLVLLERAMKFIPSSPIIETNDRNIVGNMSNIGEELERMYRFWDGDIIYFRYLGPRYQDYTLDFWISGIALGRDYIGSIVLYTNEWNW